MDAIVRSGRQDELTGSAAGETIFALATGVPPAAIAIVRLSGAGAWSAAEAIAGPLPRARFASHRRFIDPATGEIIDSGLFLLFASQASPTGEQLAEFHLHGSRAVVDAMLHVMASLPGCRLAQPGEFTWRAFRAGQLDLTEVEGLADLLAAETETQRRAAVRIVDGGLSSLVSRWRTELLGCAARIEAALDFSDEDDVAGDGAGVRDLLTVIRDHMGERLEAPANERLHGGIDVVIAGPPNAGKSTLLNALVGREAAITSDIAGTTRDLIQVPATIAGLPVRLTDGAGLREATGDDIERQGIGKARRAMADADIVLWIGDEAPPSHAIWVHGRADLAGREVRRPGTAVKISARTGEGLADLSALIRREAARLIPSEDALALNGRQQQCIRRSAAAISEAVEQSDPLLIAEGLRRALAALDQLSGSIYAEDMLDQLFSRFCIGK